jgi:GxxExxY protein
MKYEPIPEQSERIVEAILDGAFQVHRELGPGLLENIYEVCLSHELSKRGVSFKKQLSLPVIYDGIKLEAGLSWISW